MKKDTLSMLKANTIELHYWFDNESHSMDAIVQNKCEFELLGILKELSSTFNIEITIETEPFGEGGLKRWFRIDTKSKKTILTSVIAALAVGFFVTPITTSISCAVEILIEKALEDKELKELEKEKLKAEIENIHIDTKLKIEQLSKNSIIKKRRSNFYDALDKNPKTKQISIVIENNNKEHISKEYFVERKDFYKFILSSNEVDPIEIENAAIEIISPVLKKGNYKWKGIYDSETISFNMKSNEFKTLVQTKKIEFKNGSSIKCLLQLKRKITDEGTIEISEYNILRVDKYYENDNPIETSEGKFNKLKINAEEAQLSLFSQEYNKQP